MSQPFAITAEDFVQWIWLKCMGPSRSNSNDRFDKLVGYIWVILWFSYSLPPYVKGIRDADIIRDVLSETYPFDIGFSIGLALLRSLKE